MDGAALDKSQNACSSIDCFGRRDDYTRKCRQGRLVQSARLRQAVKHGARWHGIISAPFGAVFVQVDVDAFLWTVDSHQQLWVDVYGTWYQDESCVTEVALDHNDTSYILDCYMTQTGYNALNWD